MISADLGAVGLVRGVHGDFFLPRDDLILEQIRAFGAHTRPEIALVRRFVEPGDTVVDVGAHIGTFSLPLAYSVGWTGSVLAFEPNPTSFELLRLNVILNDLQSVVHVSSSALAATATEYFVVDNRTANSGASYLSIEPPRPLPRHADPDPATGTVSNQPSRPITATTLDRFLDGTDAAPGPISLIKIDVEGMEESVIAGARGTVESNRPVVYFELAAEQARRSSLPDLAHLDYLHDLDYRFVRNVGERNAAVDDFELESVDRPALDELIEANVVVDLAAVPRETTLESH